MARQAQKSPATVAQKWSTNLAASVPSIQSGVNAVTTAPTQLAAANPNGYLMGVQNAVQSGKWQQSLQAVSLTDWKNAMLNKGVQRVQTGATQAVPKFQAAMTKLLPFIYSTRDQINSTMPRGGLQQNLARANAFASAMAGYKSQ
jgi:hypothetical protein